MRKLYVDADTAAAQRLAQLQNNASAASSSATPSDAQPFLQTPWIESGRSPMVVGIMLSPRLFAQLPPVFRATAFASSSSAWRASPPHSWLDDAGHKSADALLDGDMSGNDDGLDDGFTPTVLPTGGFARSTVLVAASALCEAGSPQASSQSRVAAAAEGNVEVLCIPAMPLMFSQGVNEMQTLAIALSHNISLQKHVNQHNFRLLKRSAQKFALFTTRYSPDADCRKHLTSLIADVKQLESLLFDPALEKEKNFAILSLAGGILRLMNGTRVISCKSAKDRTSMSTTYEQVYLLERFGVRKETIGEVLDVMRREGVRRSNVIRNTGKKHYAFNALQRGALPKELSPTPIVCGSTAS